MKEKINIAEILKNYPKDMVLDCTIYEDVYFDYVDELNIIHCYIQHETHKTSLTFNQYGTPNSDIKSKCVIFPKGKTTWEGFEPSYKFKDGDIVATMSGRWIGITEGGENNDFIPAYCVIKGNGKFEAYFDKKNLWSFSRFATEEEKEKLFKAIKDNGYEWNLETKALEKLVQPKFKIGDKIRYKADPKFVFTITSITKDKYECGKTFVLSFTNQDEYELVPNKFDITTLKPFDKVLVRQDVYGKWGINFFGFYNYDEGYYYTTGNWIYKQCIPYEGNEYLLDTTNDCDEYYKIWEN